MQRRIRIPNKIVSNYVTLTDDPSVLQNINVRNIKTKKKKICSVFYNIP